MDGAARSRVGGVQRTNVSFFADDLTFEVVLYLSLSSRFLFFVAGFIICLFRRSHSLGKKGLPKTPNKMSRIQQQTKKPIKRVAVIGAGPAGAIAIDALAQERTFDLIRVFERREGPGGCW